MIVRGDCLQVMAAMAPASVDAIVTDPPYGLAFMGKGWDHAVPGVEYWREALRVAKPGAHLVAFGGTRTWHRLACAIEDAGWELRDTLCWLYSQGFPKSLDVSKAIDRMDASEEQMRRRLRFTAWVRSTGATSRQIDKATGTNMGAHYTDASSQPRIMTREHLEKCRSLLGDVPEWVEREADIRSVESRNMAEREKVGEMVVPAGHAFAGPTYGGDSAGRVVDKTIPATPAARQWSGWGTALKPAFEPIILARKPLVGTVAANVLEWGTGAVNVDGCRVGVDGGTRKGAVPSGERGHAYGAGINGTVPIVPTGTGRWPSNVCLDEAAAGMLDEQVGERKSGSRVAGDHVGMGFGGWGAVPMPAIAGDSGGPSRFYYCAKASKRDRTSEGRVENKHPTVKPNALMRWLVRLVTPPGGLVLDPFAGSGSTAVACADEGFRCIGIELEQASAETAAARERLVEREPPGLFG